MIVRNRPRAVDQLFTFGPELRRAAIFATNRFALGHFVPAGPTELEGVYYVELTSAPVKIVALFTLDTETDELWVFGFTTR